MELAYQVKVLLVEPAVTNAEPVAVDRLLLVVTDLHRVLVAELVVMVEQERHLLLPEYL